ncbi:hypothetical protein PVL29_015049 [Vitis rotundifolia]|uniref:Uncharacterized protein n=1 Tax=Vitis rotundifolia TaxID=103349 RepID=A0AA39DJ82_VITRO|nr:hypothetical protein PVL29_015049 [Vitis rotundifolia]
MSSESLEESKLSTVYDDIEELEVTEMDAALLRELLEESETEETGDDTAGYKVEPLDLEPQIDQNVVTDGRGCDCLKQYEAHIHDFDNWFGMTEMAPPLPSDAVMDWYVDTSMDEMVGMIDFGDCLQFYNAVSSDETPYSCLWQDD